MFNYIQELLFWSSWDINRSCRAGAAVLQCAAEEPTMLRCYFMSHNYLN